MTAPRQRFERWLEGYERAWRTPGTEPLAELFAAEANYSLGPYEPPVHGVDAIAGMWDRERAAADEEFTMSAAIVACEGDVAVARVEVVYGEPRPQEYRDLWVIELDDSGLCTSFEEWPFWPPDTDG